MADLFASGLPPRAALPPVAGRPRGAVNGGMPSVTAHITGTVIRVEVKPGDTVRPGDAVVVLESMKMEMPVEAQAGGRVREVRCQEGQAVSEGDVLLVLE